jgi:hypothetical protein
MRLGSPDIGFNEITTVTLKFLRPAALGAVLILLGNCFFLVNLVLATFRFYQARAQAAYAAATATLNPAQVRP